MSSTLGNSQSVTVVLHSLLLAYLCRFIYSPSLCSVWVSRGYIPFSQYKVSWFFFTLTAPSAMPQDVSSLIHALVNQLFPPKSSSSAFNNKGLFLLWPITVASFPSQCCVGFASVVLAAHLSPTGRRLMSIPIMNFAQNNPSRLLQSIEMSRSPAFLPSELLNTQRWCEERRGSTYKVPRTVPVMKSLPLLQASHGSRFA